MVVLRPQLVHRNHEIPSKTLVHLRQSSCCISTLDDPAFVPLHSTARNPPPHQSGRYSFVSKTLKTPDTIGIWEQFYRPSSGDDDDYGEGRVLIALGSGVDGHLNTAHGGVAATLLDQALGNVAGIHITPGKNIFTAYLHVNYQKPLPTPSIIIIKSRLDPRSAGRKIYVRGTLEGEDGIVYNSAEAMFLEVEREPWAKM